DLGHGRGLLGVRHPRATVAVLDLLQALAPLLGQVVLSLGPLVLLTPDRLVVPGLEALVLGQLRILRQLLLELVDPGVQQLVAAISSLLRRRAHGPDPTIDLLLNLIP